MNREKEIFEELFVRYPALEGIREDIKSAYDVICACFDRGGKLLICGNGGSAADAQHIVGELMKGFLLKRELTDEQRQAFLEIKDGEYLANHLQGALPAVALSAHEGLNTAFANDIAADMIFAQQVWAYASSSPDALIALSTSGNSANVVNAVKVANAMGIESIGITGEKMSLMSEMCTVCLRLPETETFKVQELTLPVYHIVGELMKGFLLKRELTDEQRQAFLEIKDGEYLANHLQGALPAVALSAHEGLNTAFANDIAADMIFAQQVWAYASSSPDALIALSTSGNSANVVNAVKVANAMGIESIGITGEKMSLMSEMCTVCLRLPETETFKVQELTLPVYHALCAMAEATYFNK